MTAIDWDDYGTPCLVPGCKQRAEDDYHICHRHRIEKWWHNTNYSDGYDDTRNDLIVSGLRAAKEEELLRN